MQLIKRDSKTKELGETISFRVTETKSRQLRELANKLNTTISDVLNQLVDLALKDDTSGN